MLQKFNEVVKYVTKSRAKYIQIAYTNITQNVIQLESQKATVVRELWPLKSGIELEMFYNHGKTIRFRNVFSNILQMTH